MATKRRHSHVLHTFNIHKLHSSLHTSRIPLWRNSIKMWVTSTSGEPLELYQRPLRSLAGLNEIMEWREGEEESLGSYFVAAGGPGVASIGINLS